MTTSAAHHRRTQSGQSLVEYALLLALVATVAIVVLFGIGLSVQRVYGLIAGVLGAKHDSTGGRAHHRHRHGIVRQRGRDGQNGLVGYGFNERSAFEPHGKH